MSPLEFPGACSVRKNAQRLLGAVVMMITFLASFTPSLHSATAPTIDSMELSVSGDFDGDGRLDQAIVDRETGTYRLGYQLTAGTITWVKARASGIENVTSVASGRLFTMTRDALVFTGPAANRLNVLEANDPNSASLPVSFYPSSIGPNLVIALDIGGGGNTAHDDLFVASRWNTAPTDLLTLVRNNAGTMTELSVNGLSSLLEEGERVVLKSGQPTLAGVIRRDLPANAFVAYRLTGGGPAIETSLNGLPAGVRYAWGQFNVSPLSQFLFYVPGGSNLLLRPIQELVPNTFTLGAGTDFGLGDAIGKVMTLPGSPLRLFVLFNGGTRARVYDFDGTSAPTLRQQFDAISGETFTGAGVQGNGHFTLYSSRDGSGRANFFQNYNFNGSTFVAGGSGQLPSANGLSARGNVMLFQNEPFVARSVNLLRSLNAGDWSSKLSPLPGPVTVQSESFGGASQGLSTPTATSLGGSPALAQFGLVNQYSNFFSLFSLNPAQGDEISDVRISPAPGLYAKGVVVSLSAADPSHQIYFRLREADPWTLYVGQIIRLFQNTTVQFYGKPVLGPAKSRIKLATYSFTEPPSTLDSDGDGIPDYVEIARGLDPFKGNDSDGDGYFDLDELLAGTNPNDANDPLPTVRIPAIERQAVFDLLVTPRPWDGLASRSSLTTTGAAVRVHSLAGSLLGYARTEEAGFVGVTNPVAHLMNLSVEKDERLLAMATEEHFAIPTTPGTDNLIGRELIGLLPAPAPAPLFKVGYVFSGGTLSVEANNWLAAAAASNAVTHRAVFSADLTIYDTLAALLTERKLRELLLVRGVSAASNLTLFSFRATEANRFTPDLGTLLSLESRGPSNQTAFLLQSVHGTIWELIKPGMVPGGNDLRLLMEEIYRLSSASNNAAPGVYPSPVDTARDFINTGVLYSNYLARVSVSGAQRANASSAVATILAAVPGRPTTNIELRVRSDSFAGPCMVLETATQTPSLVALFHPGGQPYRLLEAFDLVAGARLHVFAHTDLSPPGCASQALEVITVALAFVPHPTPTDLDGDLLPDEWEALFNVTNPLADDDGDGYSNLQEMLEGTDPRDAFNKPLGPIADLSPPEIKIEETNGGNLLKLSWDWPEPYASKVRFTILGTTDLDSSFNELGITPTKTGGHFELSLPNSGMGAQFFKIIVQL